MGETGRTLIDEDSCEEIFLPPPFRSPHTPSGQSPCTAHKSGSIHLSGSFQKAGMSVEPSLDRMVSREAVAEA